MNIIQFPVWLTRPSMAPNHSWLESFMNDPRMDRIPPVEMCDCVGRGNGLACLDCDDSPLGQK